MIDPEHDRLQGCIDELEDVHGAFRERLAILESIVIGNGRPGLVKMIDATSEVLEAVNNRLSRVEHQSQFVKTRNSDIWDNVKNIIYVVAFVASVGFNIYFAMRG